MALYELFFFDGAQRDRLLAGMDEYARDTFGIAVGAKNYAICRVVFDGLFAMEAEDLYKEGERVYVVFGEDVDVEVAEGLLNEKMREITKKERNVGLFPVS